MTNKLEANVDVMDAELVSRSLAGDRDSFNQIVVRYQTLICSLAYNGLGNLAQSEDVAQETFLTAWKQLQQLREPAKLRGWLCGIVRHLVLKKRDREEHEPAGHAETLDAVEDAVATNALPSEEAISREEQAILWRSLENIPSLYREPLILFYREHQSIEAVAEKLGLSEDAVKQRLARGRGLLREEVEAFVEKTLRRTAPGPAFSGLVLAALPGAPASTAAMAATGTGAAAVKSGLVASWLAPLLGILAGVTAHWLIIRAAPTAQERKLKKVAITGLWIFVLAWCIPGQLAVGALSKHLEWSNQTYFAVMAAFWFFYAVVIATFGVLTFRRISAIRQANERVEGLSQPEGQPLKWTRRIVVVAGIHLACFWWLIALAMRAQDRLGAVVVALFMIGLAVRNWVQVPGRSGTDAAWRIAGHAALIWGIILAILNWRLMVWVAGLHGFTPGEIRQFLPVWSVPMLSLAVVGWVALLLRLTKPLQPQTKSGSPT
jgi:RNA polymerase sigma factor (sigma-70 family)